MHIYKSIRSIFLLAMCFALLCSGRGLLNQTRLVEMLQSVCPGGNVCRENRMGWEPTRPFREGYTSCCADCFCDETCVANNDCCFQSTSDSVTPSISHTSLHLKSECLFPTTSPPDVEYHKFFQSYSMVSSVFVAGDDNMMTSSTNVSCGDVKVTPWGSIFPVYSPKRKRIYKNNLCAEEDGVSDGQLWDPVVTCVTGGDEIMTDQSFLDSLDSSFIYGCRIDFRYNDTEILYPQICYAGIIDTCNENPFEVPYNADFTVEEVRQACTSGLLSPYTHLKQYANAFCHMCNGDALFVGKSCMLKDQIWNRGRNTARFIALIDHEIIQQLAQPKDESLDVNVHLACLDPMGQLCWKIYCPLGQLRNASGVCIFPTKLWYDQTFLLSFHLTTDEPLEMKDLLDCINTSNVPSLRSVWLKSWKISLVLNTNNPQELYVNIDLTKSIVNPQAFFDDLKAILSSSTKWVLKGPNTDISFSAEMSKYKSYFRDPSDFISVKDHNESIPDIEINVAYSRKNEIKKIFLLSKMYICDLVEIDSSVFYLSRDNVVLFNRITNRFLFDSEFVLIGKVPDVRARVCIDDSGLYSIRDTLLSKGNISFRVEPMLISILATLVVQVIS